jgi:hypothetical protein
MSLVDDANGTYTYDHVPTLRELMPTNAGLPGVTYAIICTANAKVAQDEGWGSVERSKVFTITGPKGSADCILACQGTPIRSLDTHSGARRVLLDDDIYHLTGLWQGQLPEHLTSDNPEPQPKPQSKKTSAYDGLANTT